MRLVAKKSATRKTCNPYDGGLRIKVGGRPRPPDRQDQNGVYVLREMQTEAFKLGVDRRFFQLNAPTASGKTIVQKALAWTWAKYGELTIIAVPAIEIATSFGVDLDTGGRSRRFCLPDGSVMDWDVPPSNLLFASDASVLDRNFVKRLKRFVLDKSGRPLGSRIVVCTHAALVLVHAILMRRHRRNAWSGTNLILDEGHHSKCPDDDSVEEKQIRNKLGEVVHHYCENRPGRLAIVTATMLRGDGEPIVAPKHRSLFSGKEGVVYEYSMHQYLEGTNYIKELEFSFSIGEYDDIVREETNGGARSLRTLITLPPSKPHAKSRKYKILAQCQAALGPHTLSSDGITQTHAGSFKVKSIDLVTEDGVECRLQAFGRDKQIADYIFVQNRGREGMDVPDLACSLVLGPRGSLPMILQMIGRVLRDVEGKRIAQFHIVIPPDISANAGQMELYIQTLFTYMALGWQFGAGLKVPRKLRTLAATEGMREALKDITFGGADDDDPTEAVRGALRKLAEEAGLNVSKAEEANNVAELLDCVGGVFRAAMTAHKGLIGSEEMKQLKADLKSNPFRTGRRIFSRTIGADELKRRRGQYAAPITIEYADRLIFLETCRQAKLDGKYKDPRKIPGAVVLFGSKDALDRACKAWNL